MRCYPLRIEPYILPGLLQITFDVFKDQRGCFLESWNQARFQAAGFPEETRFVQDNLSKSRKGVLRGLHYQDPFPQGKLITVIQGAVYDVAVDVRPRSATFGQWA